MTTAKKLISAAGTAAGAAGEAVYVDDVFSTYLYEGTGSGHVITNGIKLGDGAENNTELHLTGDSLTDSSPVPKTITVVGDAQVSTSTKKYGTGSLQFDGSGDLLSVASNAHWNLNDEDFTIEFWVYASSLPSFAGVISAWNPTLSWLIETVGGAMRFYYNDGSTGYIDMGSITTTTWTHFAVTAQGSTLRTFKDGTLVTTTTKPTMNYHSNNLSVGAVWPTSVSSTGQWNGYIDDLRVTVGTARYTASFTAPTTALDLDTLVTGEGGLVWIKERTDTAGHRLYDTERGDYKFLESNTNTAEGTNSNQVSFNSDGFSTGPSVNTNNSGDDYASWTFRKQPGFFDVVTYTGNSQSVSGVNQTINHNLGTEPGMIIVKRTDGTRDWAVYHRSLGATKYLELNNTDAEVTTAHAWVQTPTSTEFYLGQDYGVNGLNHEYVAYLFAHDAQDFGTDSDESIIKCGSYGPGTETLDGPEVNLGFEPQWVLTKCYDNSGDWVLHDNMRGVATNGNDKWLRPNTSGAELTVENIIFTSTGFKITSTYAYVNQSGYNYIYIAIRRPNKPASEFAATDLFAMDYPGNITGGSPKFVSNFPVDMAINRNPTYASVNAVSTRLAGRTYLTTENDNAEQADGHASFDHQDGYYDYFSSSLYQAVMWRRAPGFFDVVAYTGDGQAGRTVAHNLGTVPEMMWVKNRDQVRYWPVFHKDININYNYRLELNSDTGKLISGEWNGTTIDPNNQTDTLFKLGTDFEVNGSGRNYIAYLFASIPGISKVGSYTGTGADLNVDCGFSAGARFVLIKRTDSTGDWYVWNSVRGIVAGNDPYLLLNSTAVEVTSTDYIDPLSSGFTVTSSAPAALNASGGTYIFYAIA